MKKSLDVRNIKCGGCANTITKKLSETFSEVEVDVERGRVSAVAENGEREALLRATLRELGYPPADESVGFVEGGMLRAKSFVSCAVGRIENSEEENR